MVIRPVFAKKNHFFSTGRQDLFKNNKPFKDCAVFKLERKLSIRNVVGKMRSAELHEMVMEKDGRIEKETKATQDCTSWHYQNI